MTQANKTENDKTPTIAQLKAQQEAIAKQLAEATEKAKAEAVTKIQKTMDGAGMSIADLHAAFPKPAATRNTSGVTLPPKFKNPETGDTWSGRGMQPKWLVAAQAAGKNIADFAIKPN